jgi:cytochrome c-type biogenesis protein CcmH
MSDFFMSPQTPGTASGRLASREQRFFPTAPWVCVRLAFARSAPCAGRLVLILALSLASLSAHAVSKTADMLPDPALEARARELGRDIRCMVCQNQSIEDSEVGLARDLRLIVRERITAGDSDEQVKSFLRARYGDFVLMKPPFAWSTAALWATPVVAVLAGLGLILAMRRRTAAASGTPAPLTEDERKRLATLGLPPQDGTGA